MTSMDCSKPYHPSLPQIQNSLTRFIYDCDSIINDLSHARNTELADMATSDYSLFGFGVSLYSSSVNHSVAARVDTLAQSQFPLNHLLSQAGLPMIHGVLSGQPIRNGESNQHSFTALFIPFYGTMASADTAGQIGAIKSTVENMRNQAQQIMNICSYGPPGRYNCIQQPNPYQPRYGI